MTKCPVIYRVGYIESGSGEAQETATKTKDSLKNIQSVPENATLFTCVVHVSFTVCPFIKNGYKTNCRFITSLFHFFHYDVLHHI